MCLFDFASTLKFYCSANVLQAHGRETKKFRFYVLKYICDILVTRLTLELKSESLVNTNSQVSLLHNLS